MQSKETYFSRDSNNIHVCVHVQWSNVAEGVQVIKSPDCMKCSLTEEFTDEWFGFEWLHFINVFSCTDECDGTSSSCHTVMESESERQRE